MEMLLEAEDDVLHAAELEWAVGRCSPPLYVHLELLVPPTDAPYLPQSRKHSMPDKTNFLQVGPGNVTWIRMLTLVVGVQISSLYHTCLLYTSPSPRDLSTSRMPSSA